MLLGIWQWLLLLYVPKDAWLQIVDVDSADNEIRYDVYASEKTKIGKDSSNDITLENDKNIEFKLARIKKGIWSSCRLVVSLPLSNEAVRYVLPVLRAHRHGLRRVGRIHHRKSCANAAS